MRPSSHTAWSRPAAEHGLPSTTATLASGTTPLDIEWIAQDLNVRVATSRATSAAPTASHVREAHEAFVDNLIEVVALAASQKILVQLTSPAALANLDEIVAFSEDDQPDWQVITLGQLHRLARSTPTIETPDVHVE